MNKKTKIDEITLLKNTFEFVMPKFHEAHEIMLAMLDFPRSSELRIADLGCGFGELSKKILMNFPVATVFGIDDKSEMLARAHDTLEGFDNRFLGFERNLENIAWAEGLMPLDAVVSSFTLDYLPEDLHRKIVMDAYELLGPLGRWISCEFYEAQDTRVNRIFHDLEIQFVQNSVQRGQLSHEQIEQLSRSTLLRQKHHTCRLDTKMDWLKMAGFKNVDVPWRFLNLAVVSGVK
jgi:tRNA (cmo5U34)-methyltransferase